MIAMLDTSTDLQMAGVELGAPVEQLLTPLTRFNRQDPDAHFAIDNGAFAGFDPSAFRSLLEREKENQHLCRFVCVPDIVASARRTLEVFDAWCYQLNRWPLALVAQDGQEDMSIPWNAIKAVFIGGSTSWKLGPHAVAVIRAAQAMEKWVHVGRVNTPGRFEYFESLGVDSIDGTGLARYSHMREAIWKQQNEPNLFSGAAGKGFRDAAILSEPKEATR